METGAAPHQEDQGLVRRLGPLDATMIVVGSMIGSGIFITSAESARLTGAPGWLILAWAVAGLMTISGALCCSELAAMIRRFQIAAPCKEAIAFIARKANSARGSASLSLFRW